jgi:long-chain-fatty-acyl-CoA reductase
MSSHNEQILLPIIVNGEVMHARDLPYQTIHYDTGVDLAIPIITDDMKSKLIHEGKNLLVDVHFDDITIFLEEVGKRWSNPSYHYHQEAVRLASRITGYSPHILEEDYQRIGRSLSRGKLYDLVEGDLGSTLLLDDWVPRQSVYMKVQPKGTVLHIMVGNVPLAGLFTITRGILSKNKTIAKLPSRDLISSLFFALTFVDIDPNHPVTRSISTVYWPGGSEIETEVMKDSNVVCAWGQGESILNVKKRVPVGVDFVEFGPKESLLLIDANEGDLDDVCMRAAYDICVYEQEACFSPQRIFVEGDLHVFTEYLAKWLDIIQARLPVGHMSIDKKAHIQRTRLEASFLDMEVHKPDNLQWTIIVTGSAYNSMEHPLSRTIFIHPVNHLEEAVEYIHEDIQTVGVHPWRRGEHLAELLTSRGACRITEVGLVSRPRPGFAHDAMLPLQRMVRWVSLERGLDYKGKHRATSQEDFIKSLYKKEVTK